MFKFNPLDQGYALRRLANKVWATPSKNPQSMPGIFNWRFWAVPLTMIGDMLRDMRKSRAK